MTDTLLAVTAAKARAGTTAGACLKMCGIFCCTTDNIICAISEDKAFCLMPVNVVKLPTKMELIFALQYLIWTMQFVSRLALNWKSQSTTKV